MRVVVIGGSGHIGTFLVPRWSAPDTRSSASAAASGPAYLDDPTWSQVQLVTADRDAEDRDGTFPARVADLEAEVVIDLICFTLESATALVEALRGRTQHLLYCGSIWAPRTQPADADHRDQRRPADR